MIRGLMLAAVASNFLSVAHAAALDGVSLPDTQWSNGKNLLLNGIGLRTYSVFSIHIYVAGLYLEHLNDNANAIIESSESKLLEIRSFMMLVRTRPETHGKMASNRIANHHAISILTPCNDFSQQSHPSRRAMRPNCSSPHQASN